MSKIRWLLAIGILQRHDSIVLGAWGCGAFGNDANEIAALFKRALQNHFKGVYQRVIFAIGNAMSDWNEAQRWNVWNDWNSRLF